MRIDVYLSENGIVTSRTEAKRFIDEGAVSVNGKQISKPSFDVDGSENIVVDKTVKEFVSRGGIKLKGALAEFGVSAEGRLCLDVGAPGAALCAAARSIFIVSPVGGAIPSSR